MRQGDRQKITSLFCGCDKNYILQRTCYIKKKWWWWQIIFPNLMNVHIYSRCKYSEVRTFTIAALWPWYSIQSPVTVKGYFTESSVPFVVPANSMRPDLDIARVVNSMSPVGSSLKTWVEEKNTSLTQQGFRNWPKTIINMCYAKQTMLLHKQLLSVLGKFEHWCSCAPLCQMIKHFLRLSLTPSFVLLLQHCPNPPFLNWYFTSFTSVVPGYGPSPVSLKRTSVLSSLKSSLI